MSECSKFDHGTILYVEEGDPKASFDSFNWKKEISEEIEKMTLNFNDPETDPEGVAFTMKIAVKRTDTVQKLKDAISYRTGLPTNAFYLVRSTTSREIKELNKTLVFVGLQNGALIKI